MSHGMVRKQSNKKGNIMKLGIDWSVMAKAAAKAWPWPGQGQEIFSPRVG